MTVSFTVHGKPQGKGRPRMTKAGHCYTPQNTRDYENEIKLAYQTQCGKVFFGSGVPLFVSVIAVFDVPKSASKAKREALMGESYTGKPDIDNIIKTLDGLNGVAWADDAQITQIHALKKYGEAKLTVYISGDI